MFDFYVALTLTVIGCR